MQYSIFLFLAISLTYNYGEDKLQQYKNDFYQSNSKPQIKIRSITRKVKVEQKEEASTDLDFSFMEEEKPTPSKRKRKLKTFTLKTIVKKKNDSTDLIQPKKAIDPLELQTHMLLSQAKMHNNTSAIQLLIQLEQQNKNSAVPLKALGLYYLQKKQIQEAVSYLKRASFHEQPSNQAIVILKKYYLKNNKTQELSKLNQYLQTKLETVDQ